MKDFRKTVLKTVTAFALVIAMAAGMAASMGGKASAQDPSTYIITYDLNGGIVAPNNSATTVTQTVGAGQKASVKGAIFYYPGKILYGWSLSKGGPVKYKPGEGNITFNGNTKLYAVWGITLYFDSFEKNKSTKLNSFSIETSNGQTTFKKIKEKLPGVPAGCYSQEWYEYYSGKKMKDTDVVGSSGRYYRKVFVKITYRGVKSVIVERNTATLVPGRGGLSANFYAWGEICGNEAQLFFPGEYISASANVTLEPFFEE